MPTYLQKGKVPSKRHTQMRDKNGNLYYEEHMSREGFSDIYTNGYHVYPPTRISKVGKFRKLELKEKQDDTHRHHHFETFKLKEQGNWISGRIPLMFNNEVVLFSAAPKKDKTDFFYRNAAADEVLFIHKGKGLLESMMGNLEFGEGDYIIVPKGVLYQLNFSTDNNRMFIVESFGPVETPKRYRNKHGQLLEHSPFCERDFRVPEFFPEKRIETTHRIFVKLRDGIQEYELAHHPFDLAGWDGFYYPWIFNIKDFMPIVGKVHMPPPIHLNFEAPGYVICSFCPRLFDFHELSIPAPYAHSNVDSDEVLYYVEGDFMSRTGVSEGSITLHPYGLPHGPQPGRYEGSIGKTKTEEYAVMVDTFNGLKVTEQAMKIDDESYPYSWLK